MLEGILSGIGDFLDRAPDLALTWLPILFFGLIVFLLWRTLQVMPRIKPQTIQPHSRSSVTWDDVAGLEEVKEELGEVVEFLRDPTRFERLGARVPKGVLFYGPPGTGKTLLAKALANASGAQFYSQSASAFVEMFAGLGASRIRKLFAEARKNAPSIVFIDELDAVGADRPRLQPRAGPDAEPAPRRAGRLRPGRAGRRHGRIQPAPGSRPRTASPGPVRSADARHPARPQGARGDSARAHQGQAARVRRRPHARREADGRVDRRRPREPVQRGCDLRGA